MSDMALTTGALTTSGIVKTGAGKLCYAEADNAPISLYDGLSSSALLICTISSSDGARSFNTPVAFNAGLFITVASSGVGVVHTG